MAAGNRILSVCQSSQSSLADALMSIIINVSYIMCSYRHACVMDERDPGDPSKKVTHSTQ